MSPKEPNDFIVKRARDLPIGGTVPYPPVTACIFLFVYVMYLAFWHGLGLSTDEGSFHVLSRFHNKNRRVLTSQGRGALL